MKRIINYLLLAAVITLGATSCLKDNDKGYYLPAPNAVVTAKTSSSGTFYLQLDDKTTLRPQNITKSPFGKKEVRALVNYTDKGACADNSDNTVKLDRNAEISWIDSIRTKDIVPTAGAEDDKKYGTAAIEVINNWITVVEDGYLTLCFCGEWGQSSRVHYINLVSGTDPDDPYVLELRHDSNGDNLDMGYRRLTGLVAFNIKSLPDTKGKTVKLKIKYRSFSGDTEVSFDYCTGTSTKSVSQMPSISHGSLTDRMN